MNQQQQNHSFRMDSNQSDQVGASINFTGQIFALDSVIVKAPNLFSLCGDFRVTSLLIQFIIAGKTIKRSIKLYCDETKKTAYIVGTPGGGVLPFFLHT